MSYMEPRRPDDLNAYRKRIELKGSLVGSVFDSLFGVILTGAIGGVALTFVVIVIKAASGGPSAVQSISAIYIPCALIVGFVASLFFFSGLGHEKRVREHFEAEARAAHKEAWDTYNDFHRRKAEQERRNQEANERWERERPERERWEAQKKAEEERERQRLAEEADLRRRVRAWQENQNWARSAFETAFQDVALHLAAEEGVTAPGDVLKVFAVLYPRLPVAADWRMGCLRELAAQDARVQAILPHLPPSNAENTRPT